MKKATLWVCCWLLWACNITETGNPSATGELIVNSTNPEVTLQSPGDQRVDEMWISAETIRFIAEGECDAPGPDAFDVVEGPFVVDLFAPMEVLLPTDERRYCGIEVPRQNVTSLPEGAPPELEGASLFVRGVRDGVPFIIRQSFPRNGRLQIEDPGQEFEVNANRRYFFAWDAAQILGTLLYDAVPNDEGVIIVDEDNNRMVHDAMADNGSLSLGFHPDVNGDGVLGPEETLIRLAKGAP